MNIDNVQRLSTVFTDAGKNTPGDIDETGIFVDEHGQPFPYFPHNWNATPIPGTIMRAITVTTDNLFSLDYNPITGTPYTATVNGFAATLLGYCRNANTQLTRYWFTIHHIYPSGGSITMQAELSTPKRSTKQP